MVRKIKPLSPFFSVPPAMSRTEWALAFARKVEEFRPNLGRKYIETVVATLWPKHQTDDPERIAVAWVAESQQ
jgi:hypothetical protein